MRAGFWTALHTAAFLAFSGCGSASTTSESPESAAPPRSPKELCLNGIHRHPRSSIQVERAVVAPLGRVKSWVLGRGGINWEEFSTSLARAPLDERVGVCVLTKRDGSRFTLPPGENTPAPQQCVVVIVRPNGEQTLFMVGSRSSMLESTPKSFAGPRFD